MAKIWTKVKCHVFMAHPVNNDDDDDDDDNGINK